MGRTTETIQFGLDWRRGKKGKIHPVKTRALARVVARHLGWEVADRVDVGVWHLDVPASVWHSLVEDGYLDFNFSIKWKEKELKVNVGAEMP